MGGMPKKGEVVKRRDEKLSNGKNYQKIYSLEKDKELFLQ